MGGVGESEDDYNDREPHKRERSSTGAGIRGCERAERDGERERDKDKRGRAAGLISSKEKENDRNGTRG